MERVPVTPDEVVAAVHAKSRRAQSLVFRWFDQPKPDGLYDITDELSELEDGGIILWHEIPIYRDIYDLEPLRGMVSAKRWAQLDEDGDIRLTRKEEVELTRVNMRLYLEEPVEGWGYQIMVMADSDDRVAYLPVMKYGSSMEGVDIALLGAFVSVDRALAELKRHGIIDADDYKGPQQIKPARPRHEHKNYG